MPRSLPSRSLVRLLLVTALGAALGVLPAVRPARAGAPSAETRRAAKQYYDQATRHYNAGRYSEAVVGYEAAYRLTPLPELLYNIGQAYRLEGDHDRALEHYRRYLELQPQGRFADTAREHVATLARAHKGERPARAPEPTPAVNPQPAPVPPGAVTPNPNSGPDPAPPAGESSGRRIWPWIVGGAAVLVAAGVVVGVVLAQPRGAPDCADCPDGVYRFP